MVSIFKKKSLACPKRVCLCLKEERLKSKISLEEMSQKTKIDKKHLQALEECRFKDLPEAVVYQKNFVKKYVEALGLDPTVFLQQYESEEKVEKKQRHPHIKIKKNYFSNLPIIIRFFLIILLALVFVGYLVIQVRNIIEPPELFVFRPEDGFVTEETQIIIQGQTDKEVVVTINGKGISTNEQGQFEETIDLASGVNTLLISARKKHGKMTDVVRHVVYKVVNSSL